jgi:hydrogenase nickel incorporation protein HypA/HybF
MHELSVASAIVAIAERHAQGRRIERVDVRIGHLRQVVPDSLAFAFELLTEGAIELHVDFVPATGCCRSCGDVSELDGFPLHCARCGGLDLEVVAGEEFEVTALHLEELTTTTGGRVHGDH